MSRGRQAAAVASFRPHPEPSHTLSPTPPPPPHCLQSDINDKMRAILIDWLVDVHLKFKVCWSAERC